MKRKFKSILKYIMACLVVWGGFGFPVPQTVIQGAGIVVAIACVVYVRYRNSDDTEVSAEFTDMMRTAKEMLANGDASLYDLVKGVNNEHHL